MNVDNRIARAEELLATIPELPTVPTVIVSIVQKLHDPEVDIQEILDLLLMDQVLTIRLLRLANSPYYSTMKNIVSLKEAILYLGLDHIKEVIYTCSIVDLFREGKGVIDRATLWSHALGVALVSKRIAKKVGYAEPDNAYIAGLLHDIGEVFLNYYLEPMFAQIAQKAKAEGHSFHGVESLLLGTTHNEVGHVIGRRWNVPKFVTDAMLYHHEPTHAPQDDAGLVSIIAVADQFCRWRSIDYGGDEGSEGGETEYAAWCRMAGHFPGIDADAIETILRDLDNAIEDIRLQVESIFLFI